MAQATIKSLTGKAFAVSADGKSFREVQVGDVLQQGEVLRPAAGARVELALPDGKTLAVAEGQAIKIDDTLAQTPQTPTAQEGAVAGGAINNVIAALERGGDLTQELEATAAGLGGGGGGDGSGFVRLLRIAEPVDPLAYDYEPTLNEIPQFERGIGETVVAEDTPTPESRTVEAALEQESGHRGAYSSGASGAGWYISGYSGGRGTDEDDGGSSLKTGNLLKGEGESLTTITVAGQTFTFSAEKPFVFLQFDKDGHLIVESSYSPESTGPYTPPAVQLVINQNGSYTMAVVGYVEHGTQTSTEDGEITDLGKAVEEFLNLDTVTATGTTNGQPMTITFQPQVQDDVPVAIDDVARVDDGYAEGNVVNGGRGESVKIPMAFDLDEYENEQPGENTAPGQDLLSADGGNTVTHVDGVKLDFTEESYQVKTLALTQMFGAPGAPMFMPAYPSGAWSQWVEGEHGRIRFKANGQYEYQHERIYSEGDNETREYVAAPGSFTVSAYDLGESIFDANGKFKPGEQAEGSYTGSDGNTYYGIDTTADNGLQAPEQANYSDSRGLSQALAFTLAAGTQATSATVTVANLYQNENGGEAARWHAFDANGVRIASGVISNNAVDAVYGSTTSVTWTTGADNKNVGTFTVNTEAPFTTLVIEALPYSNDGAAKGDSSDFYATVNSFNTVPTVEEFKDVFTYTLTDRDGDSSTATLTISGGQPVVVGELSNVAPNAEDNTYKVVKGAELVEGNIITDDNNGGGAASGRDWDQDTPVLNLSVSAIELGGVKQQVDPEGSTFELPKGTLTVNPNGAFTYTPNKGAIGNETFKYYLSDVHGEESQEPATVTFKHEFTLPTLTTAVKVGEGTENTVVIDKGNATSTDQGFTVKAFNLDGSSGAISVRNAESTSGFGVGQAASGDAQEIGESGGNAERLVVTFDDPVSSVKLQLAWLRGGSSSETALVTLLNGDTVVGTREIKGLTDTVDNFGVIEAGDQSFDTMVFSVPTGNDYSGDDYLVHSIEFVKSTTFQVDLTVKTTDFASDSLGGLVLSVPEGAQLAIGTDNGDGTWTLKAEDLASFEPSGDVFSVPLQITVAGDATVATPPTVSVVTATVADAAGNLLVKGDNSGNTLEGGEGNDILLGGDGNDTLIGGGGSDIYVTGGGNDTIEINLADSKAGDSDVVVDLGATDQINVKDLLTDDGSEVTLAPSGGDTVITADSNGATAGGTTQTVTVQNTENLVFDAAMDTIKINTGSESV